LLIHHSRPLSKRAGKAELPDLPGPRETPHSVAEIDDVLNRLAAVNPALRRVVELRVFEGLTREEIAQEMGCGHGDDRSPLVLCPKVAGGSSNGDAGIVTDERWQLAYAIYDGAVPLTEPSRRQYVQAASPNDEIASRVLTMLDEVASETASQGFNEHVRSTYAAPGRWLPAGARLGPYQIHSRIGEGGMGVVYRAHDPRLERNVAIKLLSPESCLIS